MLPVAYVDALSWIGRWLTLPSLMPQRLCYKARAFLLACPKWDWVGCSRKEVGLGLGEILNLQLQLANSQSLISAVRTQSVATLGLD